MIYNADGTMTNDFDVVLGDYYANPPDIYEIVKFITGPQTTNRGNIVLYIFGIIICIIAVVSMLFPDELFRLAMWPRVKTCMMLSRLTGNLQSVLSSGMCLRLVHLWYL